MLYMYQYEKSRKAQLHEKSFSWFWGIGGVHQQAKKAFCAYKCTACQFAKLGMKERIRQWEM